METLISIRLCFGVSMVSCDLDFFLCGKEVLSTTVRGDREECWGRKKSIGRIRVKGGGRSRDEKEERGRRVGVGEKGADTWDGRREEGEDGELGRGEGGDLHTCHVLSSHNSRI